MRRHRLWWSLVALSVVVPASVGAATDISVRLGIGNAPPPPVVVVRQEPHVVVVPGTMVYVVDDDRFGYDYFHYGTYWYIYNDGYWYRARGYRGPFRVIETSYVPRAIFNVPPRRWKHHPHGGPPGQMKKRSDEVVIVKDRDAGRGHGKGHGR